MLRAIFGVTGAGLVALGLFGGQILENLQGGLINGSDSNANLATSESVVRNVVSSIDTPSSLDPAVSGITDATSPQTQQLVDSGSDVTVVALDSNGAIAAPEQQPEQQPESQLAPTDENKLAEVPAIHTDGGTELKTTQQTTSSSSDTLTGAVVSVASEVSDNNQQTELDKSTLASAQIASTQISSTEATSSEASAIATSIQSESVQSEPVQSKQDELGEVIDITTGQISGEEILVVIKDKVNMRDGPSIEHPVVLELGLGQELMEFKREGRWVHVGAYGTSGKIGWVHQRLVETAR